MGIFDNLFGPSTTNTTSTTTGSLTPQAQGVASDLLTKAQTFANQPYTPYMEPRLAALDPLQRQAMQNTSGIASEASSLYNQSKNQFANSALPGMMPTASDLATDISRYGQQGGEAALGLAQRFSDADIQGYMNPYIQQVLDPALADLGRRASQERNALNSRSAMTGSFGGSRNAIAQAEQERNTMQEMGRLSANTRAAGFQSAADQFRKDQENIPRLYANAQTLGLTGQQGIANVASLERERANQLAQLSGLNTGRLATEVAPLYTAGALNRQDKQGNLDLMYTDWKEQRDYPGRGIGVLQSALGITPTALGTGQTTTTGQAPGPNQLAQIGGAVGGLYNSGLLGGVGSGLASLWGASGGNGLLSYLPGASGGLKDYTDFISPSEFLSWL